MSSFKLTLFGATLAVGLAAPAQAEEISVSAWGGFFEETLAEVIYPMFTAESGIEVRSVAQPIDDAWLTQLTNAARANTAPADVSLMASEALARGQAVGLWASMDSAALPNTNGLKPGFEHLDEDGKHYAMAALTWLTTLVTNTDLEPNAPTSWADLWSRDWDGRLGLVSTPNSGLIEATAVTFFGGYEIMETRDGLEQVIAKIAELRPNVKLWYRDEGQFQQGLEAGEFNAGLYYHDVTTLAAADGLPVRSNFPKEGAILGDAYWVIPVRSQHVDAATQFINFMIRPDVQAAMARNLGIGPVVRRELTDLTDEESAAVSTEIEPIRVRTDIHLREGDWLADKYLQMIAQ